ncbi:MAG TPA: patatin-like phospholipase family protein [Roseomonas sp.]|jgi:NTE family protein
MSGDGRTKPPQPRLTAFVLSGGVALGAYEAGIYEALEEQVVPDWLLGASAGSVNAAIIAGNPPGQRVDGLRRFWNSVSDEPMPWTSFWLGPPPEAGAWRRVYNETAALRSLLLGRPGVFRMRLGAMGAEGGVPSLYDLEPLRSRLPECIDFDRLNHPSAPRLTVVATDVVSGDRVIFDTARGTRIGPEHLLASSALLPIFAPLEVEGRLLGDGGLSSNAPLDLVLDEPAAGPVLCVLTELFPPRGSRPQSIGAALSRAGDLGFGNQTRRMLEAGAREYRLRALVGRLASHMPPDLRDSPEVAPLLAEAEGEARDLTLLLLGYRAGLDEAGPGKVFDFSRATLADRWLAGSRAMRDGLDRLGNPGPGSVLAPGLTLVEVDR